MKNEATTKVVKGMTFTTQFGSTYQVLRVMPKSGKVTVCRMKSGATSNWAIQDVEEVMQAAGGAA